MSNNFANHSETRREDWCPPPPGLRSIRANALWRKASGSEPLQAWGVDDIVLALVIRAFGEPVESGGVNEG
jgi:hypothetical protein